MIRVVVVEDSPVQQRLLVRMLEADRGISVVGTADSVDSAVEVVGRLEPDVVTMDLELPGARGELSGGAAATDRIMARRATPILIVSAYAASRDAGLAVEALAAGAVDLFPKPGAWTDAEAVALRRRVGVLSRVRMTTRRPPAAPRVPALRSRDEPVVALVASTGGPSALRTVVAELAGIRAPILVVQHIHDDFAASFATWLQDATGVPVILAAGGERLRPGTVHVAPGGVHLRLAAGRTTSLDPEPADVLSRPSGDELLNSVARHAGAAAIAAVMTGMGEDGARGLKAVRDAGGTTFAQDGETSVVDGMPRRARELGAAGTVLALEELGPAIAQAAHAQAARGG